MGFGVDMGWQLIVREGAWQALTLASRSRRKVSCSSASCACSPSTERCSISGAVEDLHGSNRGTVWALKVHH